MNETAPSAATAIRRTALPREFWPLAALFACLYFLQGIGEPTEGLIAQPVANLLKQWDHSPGEIAWFAALTSLPWAFKPAFGLLCDFVPLPGGRHRVYLTLATVLAAGCLCALYVSPAQQGESQKLLRLVLVATFGVAFGDVVVDSLMVEKGRLHGITGWLQSVQWGALYAATLLVGLLGGELTERGLHRGAFLICAVCAAAAAGLALFCIRESPNVAPREPFWASLRLLGRNLASPMAWRIAAFLCLWNFNPFSSRVLHLYMTGPLGLSEKAYGQSVSLFAVGSLTGCATFPFLARRASPRLLAHGAIVLGIAGNLAYLALRDESSSQVISVLAGMAYMLATLAQLDLAANACAPRVVGTMFAIFMSVSNLSTAGAIWAGGAMQDLAPATWSDQSTFDALVVSGAAFTAGCWLVLPTAQRT